MLGVGVSLARVTVLISQFHGKSLACLPSLCSLKQLVPTELKLAHSKYFPCFGVVLPEHFVPSSTEVRKFYHSLMQN